MALDELGMGMAYGAWPRWCCSFHSAMCFYVLSTLLFDHSSLVYLSMYDLFVCKFQLQIVITTSQIAFLSSSLELASLHQIGRARPGLDLITGFRIIIFLLFACLLSIAIHSLEDLI